MHTMGFNPDDLDVEIGGTQATLFDMFPGFDKSDRLGVVIDSSVGLLGASLFIHAFAAAYFKHRRMQGSLVTQYPETYAFHLGGRYGDLRMLDVLPERKEVFVLNSDDALAAINHAAITRVLVPNVIRSQGTFHPWEMGPAKDRVRTTYVYSVDGQVSDPSIVIKGKGRHVFDDFHCIFDIQHTIDVHAPLEPDPAAWAGTLRDRAGEVLEREASRARSRWDASVEQGVVTESFATLPVAMDFLHYL